MRLHSLLLKMIEKCDTNHNILSIQHVLNKLKTPAKREMLRQATRRNIVGSPNMLSWKRVAKRYPTTRNSFVNPCVTYA